MKLKEFIEKYDFENSVVLLESKRNVAPSESKKLIELGKLLAEKTKYILFMRGNAAGADYFFSMGVADVDQKRLQVITPYNTHRKKENLAYDVVSLGDINIAQEPLVVYHTLENKKNQRIVQQYIDGEKNKSAFKAAYLIRDTVKVLGTSTIKPATFAIFYDDLDNPGTGGTGHTMEVCKRNNIPFIDQRTWMEWL